MQSVALVCATIGRWDALHLMLQTAAAGSLQPTIVVLVVQGGEAAPQSLTSEYPVHVIYDEGMGLSRARNQGLQWLQGCVESRSICNWTIGFPDDDVWFDSDTLLRVSELRDEGFEVVCGRLADSTGSDSRAQWPLQPKILTQRNFIGNTIEAATFISAHILLSGLRFNEILGVGSSSGLGSGEGVELLHRALASGAPAIFDPAVCVYESPAHTDASRRRVYAMGEGASLYMCASRHAIARLLLRPPLRPINRLLHGNTPDLVHSLERTVFMWRGAWRARALLQPRAEPHN